MTKRKLKAAIYTRVSTEEQKKHGFSLDAQKETVMQYAIQNGYEIYDCYSDSDSGKDFNRPEIQRLFTDMRKEKFDVIIIWKVDRISRKNTDVLRLIDEELNPRNMKLLVTTCNIDSSTTNGYMFISLLGTFAEYERSVIIERVSAGMEKKSKLGQWNGGVLLGYDVVDKELVINESESVIVKRIFEMRAAGKGYKAIVSELNSHGYRTKRNNPFSINSVKTILENETYIGHIRWGKHRKWATLRRKGKVADGHVEKGIHEPIIDMETWELANQVAKSNRSAAVNEKNKDVDFLLSGILRCPQCGGGTVMTSRPKDNGNGYYFYYVCNNSRVKGSHVCTSNLIVKDWVEKEVLSIVKKIVARKSIVDEIVETVNQKYIEENAEEILLHEQNKKRLVELENDLDRLDSDYRSGEISAKSFGRLSEKTESDIAVLQEQVFEYERKNSALKEPLSTESVSDLMKGFDQVFDEADIPSKKMLIRSLIKRIDVTPDRKRIKSIVFWDPEDNAIFLENTLTQEPIRRTVS